MDRHDVNMAASGRHCEGKSPDVFLGWLIADMTTRTIESEQFREIFTFVF